MHNFEFIKQYKGKDLNKVTQSQIQDEYYCGTKYDGNYVQIHKFGDQVMFFSSGGKPFCLDDIEAELVENNKGIDFIIEVEYTGLTDGKLGSRGECTTTTWRTNFSKLINCNAGNAKFKAFDILYLSETTLCDTILYDCIINENNFEDRYICFEEFNIELGKNIDLIKFHKLTLEEAKDRAKWLCDNGWEGLFLFHEKHIIKDKGRSNLAIKLKMRPTADLKCINVTEGEGKYLGMIGSLVLVDSQGRIVKVGAGLSDDDRDKEPEEFVGKVIEIEYEQILDTYIQPTYKCIRENKEID